MARRNRRPRSNNDPRYKGMSPGQAFAQYGQDYAQQQRYAGMAPGAAIAQYGQDYAAGMWPIGMAPPAAGAAPGASLPQPFDPSLAAAQQQATWNRGLGDAEASYQRGEAAWGLGYNADGSLNAANPYSQAQLLQNEYKRSVTGANNSMAAAGQYDSGARLNAQARNDRGYAEGSSQLRDRARQTYHGIGFGQLSSYGSSSLGLTQEQWDALRRGVYGG